MTLLRTLILFLAVALSASPALAKEEFLAPVILQNAATATGDGTILSVQGYNAAVIKLEIGSATVTWEAGGATSDWVAVRCSLVSTNANASTASASGLYICNTAGMTAFRARISAYTSGSVTVTAQRTTAHAAAGSGFLFDSSGNLIVSLGTLLSGEDQTANVLRVEGQFSYSGNKTADTQVKASAGYVHNLVCIGTDAAATAGTIILYDNTAESGTVVMSWAVQAAAYAQPVVFPLDVVMATGIYLGFTTTADVTCTVSYR